MTGVLIRRRGTRTHREKLGDNRGREQVTCVQAKDYWSLGSWERGLGQVPPSPQRDTTLQTPRFQTLASELGEKCLLLYAVQLVVISYSNPRRLMHGLVLSEQPTLWILFLKIK